MSTADTNDITSSQGTFDAGQTSPPGERSGQVSEQSNDRGQGSAAEKKQFLRRKERKNVEDVIDKGNIQVKEVSNGFASLPDEIIVEIFKHLPQTTLGRTAQVSHRWCQISKDPIFWKDFVFAEDCLMDSGALSYILARGCEELIIEFNCKVLDPIFTDEIPEESYALKKLEVECSEDFDMTLIDGLESIVSRCQKLTHINIHFDISDDADLFAALAECPNLTEMTFSADCGASYEGCLAVFTACRRLEKFINTNLNGDREELESMQGYSSEEVWSLLNVIPPSMKETTFLSFCLSLTDEHVELLVTKAPNLTHLDLWSCEQLTGRTVEYLSRLSNLVDLHIGCCGKIPYEALGDLEACKNLKSLNVANIVKPEQGETFKKRFPQCRVFIYHYR